MTISRSGRRARRVRADVETVHVGQPQVEQQHVVRGARGLGQSAPAPVRLQVGRVAVAAQAGLQVAADGVVVLDDQHAGDG